MRSLKTFVIALAVIVVAGAVVGWFGREGWRAFHGREGRHGEAKPEENYWEVMKEAMEADYSKATPREAKAAARKWDKYIKSLTAEQLLIAGRQCSVVVQQHARQEQWAEAVIGLWVPLQYYPAKTNNLKDVTPLVAELQDKSAPPFWRYGLMAILWDSWSERGPLTIEQLVTLAIAMKQIAPDKSEPLLVRIQAAKTSEQILRHCHAANLKNDPELRKCIAQGRKYEDAVRDAVEGRIVPAGETVKRNTIIQAALVELIDAHLGLLNEPNLPVIEGQNLIGSACRLVNYDAQGKIHAAMKDALRNYKNYDEHFWWYLVYANATWFENPEAESLLVEMIDTVTDEDLKRMLPRWKRSLEDGGFKRRPYNPGSALVDFARHE